MKSFDTSNLSKINYRLLLSTRRYLVFAAGLSLVSIIVFFSLIFPRIQSIQENRKELEQKQKQLTQSSEKLKLLLNVNQTTLFQEKERIDALLPSYKPLLPLIARMEQLSAENHVIVTSFQVSPGDLSLATDSAAARKKSTASKKQVNSNVSSLPLSLLLYGTINDLYNFLDGIDTLVPLADITGITLSSSNNIANFQEQTGIETTDPIYEAELNFEAYFYARSTPLSSQQNLPNSQLRPDLLLKLQSFQLPVATATDSAAVITGGGKINLFE